MSGQRGPGQKPILVVFDVGFLRDIALAMKGRYSDRSKFIRDAVYEKLVKLGIQTDYKRAMAPSRIRSVIDVKGRHNHVEQNLHLNQATGGRYDSDEDPMISAKAAEEKKKSKRKK